MSIVLDAGALLAIERGDPDLIAIIKRERLEGRAPLTHGGSSGRSGVVATDVKRPSPGCCRGSTCTGSMTASGEGRAFLGAAGMADVIDAAVVLLAQDGDEVFTSDPDDLRPLAEAARRHAELILV